ncbi:ROK family protein [Olivibacter sp. SDN3]|uniref:ROK family protein n=1 Tax=Olivibacter sp. SDN3 TaxID=2764720 RepID=UPI0016514EA3|nr:ROK family protein [Olivibacter sp. SDN3]QNL48093.1 ROK family protein [Olivibacter sp. SDN3]
MKNIEETVLGADVGGSHITAAIVDTVGRSVVPHSLVRRRIDAHASASVIMDAWVAALNAAEEAWGSKCTYLAVSMPGPFDYERGISLIKGMNKYEALYGIDIRQVFAERMKLPVNCVRFVNDAEAFLRGEVLAGPGSDVNRVFGVTLGTGLGSALFEEGRVKDLNLGSSPFLGGIAEDYISTRGILAFYRSLGGGEIQDVKTLVERVDEDSKAQKAINQLALWLADFLLIHLPVLRPDLVIIGGNISKAYHLFLPKVSRILHERNISTPIKVAEVGEQAAILGAASFVNYIKNAL